MQCMKWDAIIGVVIQGFADLVVEDSLSTNSQIWRFPMDYNLQALQKSLLSDIALPKDSPQHASLQQLIL